MKGVKTGGRTAGVVNKTTAEIREHYQNLVSNNLEQLDSDLKSLEPLQRLKILIELSKFIVPTLKATELTTDIANNGFQSITVTIVKPDEVRQIMNELENKY